MEIQNHTSPSIEDTNSVNSEQSENLRDEEMDEATDLPVIKGSVHQGKLPPLCTVNDTPLRIEVDDSLQYDSPRPIDLSKVPQIRLTGARGSVHTVQIDNSPNRSPRNQSIAGSVISDIENFNKEQKYRKRLDMLSILAGVTSAAVMVIGAISFVFQPYVFNTGIGLWGGGLAMCFGIYGATTLVHCKYDCRFPIQHAYAGITIALLFSFGLFVAFCISLGFDRQYLSCTYKDGLGDCGTNDVVLWRVPPNYKFAAARIWIEAFGIIFSIGLIAIHTFEFVSVKKLAGLQETETVEVDE